MRLLLLFLGVGMAISSWAQSSCPDCTSQLPATLAEDTIFLSDAATGTVGVPYESDISFRFPKTTTPVADVSDNVPGGLSINEIRIVNVANVPPGLNWEASQESFKVQELTDGCVRFCGTPLVAGLYIVEVVVEAQILVLTETTSVSFPILIEPDSRKTQGFSISSASACGQLEVELTNLNPSNGQSGFSYRWDFGDGTESTAENPTTKRYTEPGSYPINYEAIIDTSGFFLTEVRINSVTCGDLFNNRADLKFRVFDPDENEVYASVVTENTDLPFITTLTLPLGPGNYRLFVEDEDSGLGGGDDNCGNINFTRTNSGVFTEGGLEVELIVLHPVDTIRASEVVTVLEQPGPPAIEPESGFEFCASDSATLAVTNFTTGLQWYRDSFPLSFSDSTTQLRISDTAAYRVVHTADNGCRSEAVFPRGQLLPTPGPFTLKTFNNTVELTAGSVLPEAAAFRWYRNDTLIAGEQTSALCITESGEYRLEVTDLVTGCTGSATMSAQFDPVIACTVSTEAPALAARLRAYPNPASDRLFLEADFPLTGRVNLSLFNALGQSLWQEQYQHPAGEWRVEIPLSFFPSGYYYLSVRSADGSTSLPVQIR